MAAALCLCAFAGPLAALAQADAPSPHAPMLVISGAAVEQIVDAGGEVVGPFTAPFAALAAGDRAVIERLEAADAWLVVDAAWLAALCGVAI
ncbi:MAG: hypothetical protein AAFN79_20570 [Pseudomonadota bacterium]